MSRAATCILLALVIMIGLSSSLLGDDDFVPEPLGPDQKVVPGMVIVQFKEYALPQHQKVFQGDQLSLGNTSIDALNEKYGAYKAEQVFAGIEIDEKNADLNLPNFYAIFFDPKMDVMEAVFEYGKNEYAVLAHPNHIYELRDMSNDPMLADQYWLHQANDLDIDAPEVWSYEPGSNEIIVAVNDTGVLWNHPDLLKNIWQNLGEDLDGDGRTIQGNAFDPDDINGVDDDGNGWPDDFIGYDWCNVYSSWVCPGEDYGGYDNDPVDFAGHGTNIAGLMSAATNNGAGVSGIAGGFYPNFPGVRIMCLRSGYLSDDCETGNVDSYAGVQAMNYARLNGADVINISYGPPYSPPCSPGYGLNTAMRSAIINCLNDDIVVTVAAGNDAVDCPDYMALIPGVINVAALASDDSRAWFSNYGDWIHISAAGVDMQTTEGANGVPGYAAWNGTSYSAPVVAGVAALVRSHDPLISNDSVLNLLMNTADPLSNPDLGAGRVNANNAVTALPTAGFTSVSELDTFPPFSVSFTDISPTSGITDWAWDFGDGGTSDVQNPTHEYTQAGIYDVSLTITSPSGQDSFIYPKMVFAVGDTLWIDQISELTVGQTVDVYFNLKNTESLNEIKVPFVNDPNLSWVDYTIYTDGTRCDYFEKAAIVGFGSNRAYIHLRADDNNDHYPDPLEPGSGPIFYLKFQINAEGTYNFDLGDAYYDYFVAGDYFTYEPFFVPGYLSTESACQGKCGDANNDGGVNVSDAVSIINYVFVGGDPPQPFQACGDANSDSGVNVSDAVFIINFVFVGGGAPTDCAAGSPAWGGSDCCEF
ncbi:MAG: S8 family serine peptidase [candidate division Zixibacteria bacterium]|nr:S8 family serine peptidase [candidate division Zixibacteria bacterium]NIT53218.1 S8 family serine peptidase [candidate division Zixibacteria bacterium]NIW41452.1 S8 family serine peptidase [candidate division Zixibacteria bacterium]NIX55130.1 S8 family serine peptidase [candidate division Zixibacteria bacterium]